MSDDTIAFTDDDIAALHAMLDHKCTPRWWPHHLGDTWTCDECRQPWVTDRAGNMGGVSAKAIELGLLDPDTLGWRRA